MIITICERCGVAISDCRCGRAAIPVDYDLLDTAMGFDQWSACGCRICKGQRSRFSDLDGEPQFTVDQVWRPRPGWKPRDTVRGPLPTIPSPDLSSIDLSSIGRVDFTFDQ